MSMWDMLTYMEVSNANSKLEDISRENREHRENQLEQEINHNITSLFQDLYKGNNDVSNINLSKIPQIKDYINNKFNLRKHNTNKPKYDFGMFVFVIILGIVIYFISNAMLDGRGSSTVQWIILAVAGFFLFGSISYIFDNQKERDNFDLKIKNFNKELPLLKIQFPDLSAFGVYLKWYIDSQCKNAIDILKKQNKDTNPYETLRVFYTLFDLNANPTMNYNWNLVYNFNNELIKNFDNLEKPNLKEIDGDYFIETTIEYANGNIYIGRLKNGLLDGEGKLIYANKESYREGIFVNGELEGIGKTQYDNGDIYEGEFKNGLRHGLGKYIYKNGAFYDGEWQDGDEHGHGKVKFTDGCIYEGEFKNGTQHGQGFLDCPSHTYKGEFENGKKNGKGKLTSKDGDIFEGYFKNNDFIGENKI